MTWSTEQAKAETQTGDRPWVRAPVIARTRAHRAREAKAVALIEQFVERHGRVIVAWSGGKDSTALACLAGGIPGVHVAHFDAGLPYPGVAEWMEATATKMGWDWGVYKTGDALDALVANGSWDFDADTVDYDRGSWWETIIAGPRRLALEATGAAGMMWGLRAEESAGRRVRLAQGLEFRDADLGLPVLCPLGWWSVENVWAAQLAAGVGVCPVYERLADVGCPEVSQRLDIMVGSDGRENGRFVWLERGWPDEFAELARVLPRIREWT